MICVAHLNFTQLRDNGSFTTLIAKVTKDRDDQNRLRGILRREREISDTARQLDKTIVEEKLRHLRQVVEQQALVTQLKQQLKSIKSKTVIDVNSLQNLAEARTCSKARIHRQTERSQETKASSLEQHRETEKMVHESTVEFLEVKQQQLTNKLTWWANKYRDDYTRLELRLKTLTQERISNLDRLTFLKKRRDSELKAEHSMRANMESKDELERLFLVKSHEKRGATAAIQSAVRTFLERKAEDDARRAADKKKKKGGKN